MRILPAFLVFAFSIASARGAGFTSDLERDEVLAYQASEHDMYGSPLQRAFYIRTAPRDGSGPSIMQRSGRRRLYDHNLFFRAVYQGRFAHEVDGDFRSLFEDAVFVDVGSAILNGEGAPTCRDLFEDEGVYPFWHRLVATDIDDAGTGYVTAYRARRNNLPFEVRTVPLVLDAPAAWSNLVRDARHPLIVRSANSGPDLYYDAERMPDHFASLSAYAAGRPLLYLFGKYLLFQGPASRGLEIVGEMDYDVGFNHRAPIWGSVDWSRRSWEDSFRPRGRLLSKAAPTAAEPTTIADRISSAYRRAAEWQRRVAEDPAFFEADSDREMALALSAVAKVFLRKKGRLPSDLAELAKYALTLTVYDFRRIDRLLWNEAEGRVEVKP